MNHSGFTIKLKLAYAPLCNFDFASIKSEPIMQEILQGSMLYAICQKPILTFDNINYNNIEGNLNFDIRIQGQDDILNCTLPLYQELIEKNDKNPVNVLFGSYNKSWEGIGQALPVSNVNGIKIYDKDMNFILWISPDKLIYLFLNNILKAEIIGNIKPFTTYLVHYVGKATEQEVWTRLTGHATLQEILSIENPFNYGTLPTHEITLLLFRVADLITIRTLGDNVDEFVDGLMSNNLPNDKVVSLDAEKLLINLLDPSYNDKKFPNYPKSKDGLFQYNFNRYLYHIAEDITLKYNDRVLEFGINEIQSDLICIEENKEVIIIKHE